MATTRKGIVNTEPNSDKRDNTIEEVLSYNGLSVVVRNEQEYKHIQKFLGEDVLYIDWVPQMSTRETGIIIWSSDDSFSTGSVGCAEYQRKHFFRTVEFSQYFSGFLV
jgi:hypothetical protein